MPYSPFYGPARTLFCMRLRTALRAFPRLLICPERRSCVLLLTQTGSSPTPCERGLHRSAGLSSWPLPIQLLGHTTPGSDTHSRLRGSLFPLPVYNLCTHPL